MDIEKTAGRRSSLKLLASMMIGAALLLGYLFGADCFAAKGPIELHVRNAVPKFLRFYNAAVSGHLTPSQRWSLWKRDYDIAAVPPSPQGRALARRRLSLVWNRYRPIIAQLPRNSARAEAAARTILPEVAALLHSGSRPIDVDLVLFVGEFSDNAFTVPGLHGAPATIYIPVEMSFRGQRIALAHEFTHAVHVELDNLKNMYLEPIGETVLKEGLAMHASRHIVPGYAVTRHTPASIYGPSWQTTCVARRRAVLRGILPYLASSSGAAIARFTYGKGTIGMHMQLYCAGWVLVGDSLADGDTYASLARVPEPEMPGFVAKMIEKALKRHH